MSKLLSEPGPRERGKDHPVSGNADAMLHYVEIIFFRAYADLKAEAARGYLGVLWWILEPLIYLGLFSFFFVYIRQHADGKLVPFLLTGLVAWKWFASTLPACSKSIAGGVNLMRQVYLPKYIFPWVSALTNAFKFLVVFCLLLTFLLVTGVRPTVAWLALPLLVAAQFFFMLAVSGVLAALVPFVPDLNQIISNMLMPLFFLSGVIFDISRIPEPFQSYLYFNPLAALIADYRRVLIDGAWPGWGGLGAIFLLSAVVWAAACALMRRFDRVYPKVLA